MKMILEKALTDKKTRNKQELESVAVNVNDMLAWGGE